MFIAPAKQDPNMLKFTASRIQNKLEKYLTIWYLIVRIVDLSVNICVLCLQSPGFFIFYDINI